MGEKLSRDNQSVVSITSVSKAFGSRLVLNNIDLQIAQGQGVCICGVNGAGKSTLLRIIAGLLRPTSGSVKICGFDIGSDPEKTKPRLGLISHKSMLYPNLTVFENLLFFARLYGVKDSGNRVGKLIEDIGLSSYRYDRAGILSRGMLQRLAIARAIVHQPAVLLADEPFTGLDTQASRHLISVLGKFRDPPRRAGTLVMTTHDANVGLGCCDRVLVLDGPPKAGLILDAMTSRIDTGSFRKDYLSYARSYC